jgi:DNA polymerase-3 subunit epsilon
MTTVRPEQAVQYRRKGLRRRMVASLLGLAAIPLLFALTSLFFVIHDDVSDTHGKALARETEQLAERLRAELARQPQPATAAVLQKSLETCAKREAGSALLYTTTGERLAGPVAIPLPPMPENDSGWLAFEAADDWYFAGVAALSAPGTRNDGRVVAVVLPASEVFRHFYSMSSKATLLLAICGLLAVVLAWRMSGRFLRPILEIRRGAEIVSHINLSHRIELDSDDELEDLAQAFNHMAGSLGRTYEDLEARVLQATGTLQEERNRLATVLRTMVDGVVVANAAAETILLNPRARIILDHGYTSGIGATLSRIFPADRVEFHLKRLRASWEQGRETVEEVIFPLADGKLLKGTLSAIPGHAGELAGFLLVFRDMRAPTEHGNCFETTLRDMPQLLRGPVATSRSLVETLQRHRDMPAEKQQAFLAALAEEMNRLNERVAAMEECTLAAQTSRWPAISSHPRELLEEALGSIPGVCVLVETHDEHLPLVQVEPFSWVASLRCVLHWIEQRSSGRISIAANLAVEDGAVVTTFRIRGPFQGDPAELESLEVSPAGEAPLSLGDTVRRNKGELWTRSLGEDGHEIRLGLLQAASGLEGAGADGFIDGEPEFYDFDLFLPRPVFEKAELLDTALPDLEYVVFDTETTGVQLSQGDKIVSISAIRIRRGKILNADVFHTLVNPQRPIPMESVQFHHIEDHMVLDAPTMNEVYPRFVEFAGDSVLVAHNAAFDKKALDMAAAEAGLPQIDNPILDTLFLSYGIHEGTEGHSLDAMAERMGIVIEGRHSSMGDARATAQAFLGLITLLPARGVTTLAEAKGFCDRHLLLRWQSSKY